MSEPSDRLGFAQLARRRLPILVLVAVVIVGAALFVMRRDHSAKPAASVAASVDPKKPGAPNTAPNSAAATTAPAAKTDQTAVVAPPVPPPPPAMANTIVPAGAHFSVLAARLLPAVVNISTSSTVKPDPIATPHSDEDQNTGPGSPFDEFFKDFSDRQNGGSSGGAGADKGGGNSGDNGGAAPQAPAHPQKSIALGSGFIIDPAGLVVTNNHVIADADEITVILQDNTQLKAQLVGRDVLTDLALLRVKADHKLPAVPWGDSDKIAVGDWVLAVGNPFGLGGTLTAGLISGRERAINNGGPYDEFLQTDASINRGNSGGPLFDLKGNVIGINAAIFSPSGGSIGLGFAIPSDLAKGVIAQLNQFGKIRRGWLGLRVAGADQDEAHVLGLQNGKAVLVGGIVPHSPASIAGIKPGDLIVGIDGKDIDTPHHLLRLIGDSIPGTSVKVALLRHSARQVVAVNVVQAVEDTPAATPADADPKPTPAPATTKAAGLSLSPVTPELKQKYDLSDKAQIVVVAVAKDSSAATNGIKSGDAILEAGQKSVKSPADLAARIGSARQGGQKTLFLLVERRGDLHYVGIRVDRSVG